MTDTATRTLSLFSLFTARRLPPVTRLLVIVNVGVFAAMLMVGAGLWHSPNQIQLAWGANFAPATADGEWWRLASAMFLHFGAVHLGMNMLALWDGGKLVERMFGSGRFLVMYLVAGISGNLLSLVIQGNQAISGGASGAIFGIYGCLLVYLWIARSYMQRQEFRWLFWGAVAFSALTIAMGFVISGIDNSAHIGGFVTGLLWAVVLFPALPVAGVPVLGWWPRALAATCWLLAILLLATHIPAPKYKWQDELQIQNQLRSFLLVDQYASREWQALSQTGNAGALSFDAWATQIDQQVAQRYEDSFEALSRLPNDPNLPSAGQLAEAKRLAQAKRDASKAAAEKLRNLPFMPTPAAPEAQ